MMPANDDLSRLIDAARSGRLSRQEVFLRGAGLGLSDSATLALARAVPETKTPLRVWRDHRNAVYHSPTQRLDASVIEIDPCW